jgi:hypothetical protein
MTNWTRKFKLGLAAVVAVAATGGLGGCFGDTTSPSEPTAAPAQAQFSRAKISSAQQLDALFAQGLLWNKPRSTAKSVTKVIGSKGGSVDFGETGLHLEVPRGAVAADTRFTVTALPGSVVAYDFEPHGSVFAVPLVFSQDLGPTNFGHVKLPLGFNTNMEGAYFSSEDLIDQTTGLAVVQEVIPAEMGITFTGKSISFPIHHFSGYLISTGRSGSR